MRKIARWAGILWMAAVAAYSGVIGGIEFIEGTAVIFPATAGIGEATLMGLCAWPGYLLYCWGAEGR